MSIQETFATIRDTAAPARASAGKGYLFGPVVDFLCLGGLSLFILPFALLLPATAAPSVAITMLVVANLVNHPHFAHSYQIFYRDYAAKLAGRGYDREMRARYAFAGIVAPAGLAAFLIYAVAIGDLLLLGRAFNVMAFFVGWHYVKQGYGMLMVDAALKRQFFDPIEKIVLVSNAYAVWVLAWVSFNVAGAEGDMWGIKYYAFALPPVLKTLAIAVTLLVGAASLVVLARRWQANGRSLPYNGVMAYAISLYPWLLYIRVSPIWLLMVPALHSLQYLLVVWRYEINRSLARDDAFERPKSPVLLALLKQRHRAYFCGFVAAGTLLGFLGFWAVPVVLGLTVPIEIGHSTVEVFLFTFWVFINVHHYFMDNVIWRRQNPDTRRFLFGAGRPPAVRA